MEKHGTSNTLSRDNSAQCVFLFYFVTDIKKEYKKSIKMTSANAFGDWPMKQNDSIISWYTIRKPNYKCY